MASKKEHRMKQHGAEAIAIAGSGRKLTRPDIVIAIGLVVVTLAVYSQVLTHQFIGFDDDVYITSNQLVIDGLTLKGIKWAFTTFESANWHPLTWLSHMLDSQIFGLNAGGHLFVNASIHAANSLLLFLFFRRVTGARWCSAMVAALFALHPLHVESVAWAAERKDTLSTFLGLLSLLAYVRYVANPSGVRYVLVVVWLALGLMAKPMLVSWPFIFLVLDYWPFRRIEWEPAGGMKQFMKNWLPLIREKIPLFCLVIPSMIVTYLAQSYGGAMSDLVVRPLSWRLANSLVAYAKYLLLTFWPSDLALLYPSSREIAPFWQWAGALVLLGLITLVAVRQAKRRPYLIAGWLLFLGALIPVIGLVRIGSQTMADRYTYVPSIGLFFALVFTFASVAKGWRLGRVPIIVVSVGVIVAATSLTARQLTRWTDSETLFTYTLSVTADNVVMQYNLANALERDGKHDQAVAHFAEAVRIKPNHVRALSNMGLALRKQGKSAEAIPVYERALGMESDSFKVHWQYGEVLEDVGRNDEALTHFREAVRLAPGDSAIRTDYGVKLARQNKIPEAMEQFEEALRIDPNNAAAHCDLGLAFLNTGKLEKALQEFTVAQRLNPNLPGLAESLRRTQEQLNARPK